MDGLKLNSTRSLQTNILAVSMFSEHKLSGAEYVVLLQAIDTGTTLIYVPEHVAQSFYSLVSVAYLIRDRFMLSRKFRSLALSLRVNMAQVHRSVNQRLINLTLFVDKDSTPTHVLQTSTSPFPSEGTISLLISTTSISVGPTLGQRKSFHAHSRPHSTLTTHDPCRDCVGGILSLGDGFPADLAIIGTI